MVASTAPLKKVIIGESFTVSTVTVCSIDTATPLLSITVKLIPRLAIPGVSLLLLKSTARATSCTNALVAKELNIKFHATLLLTEAASAVPITVLPAISLLPADLSSQIPLPPGFDAARLSVSAASAFAVI